MLRGSALLHHVAERIILRYLGDQGYRDAALTGFVGDAEGIDITYVEGGRHVSAKVKADSYFGVAPDRVADRSLTFYRPDTRSYGLEVIANTATREAGWVSRSRADLLYYYRIAIAQTEDEVAALAEEPDAVFFAELAVDRDDLRVIPIPELRTWFESAVDRYTPRPVMSDGRSAWYRIVPEGDVEGAIAGVRRVGSIFPATARR